MGCEPGIKFVSIPSLLSFYIIALWREGRVEQGLVRILSKQDFDPDHCTWFSIVQSSNWIVCKIERDISCLLWQSSLEILKILDFIWSIYENHDKNMCSVWKMITRKVMYHCKPFFCFFFFFFQCRNGFIIECMWFHGNFAHAGKQRKLVGLAI